MADLIVIGVDPGYVTGIAVTDVDARKIYVGYQDYHWEAVDGITEWLSHRNATIVMIFCEKYTITQNTVKMTRQDHALKVCGALEWFARRHDYLYEEQSKATAGKIAQDARLREMGLYVRTQGGHANDATRHLLLGMERKTPTLLERDPLIGYNGDFEIVTRLKGST